MELKCTYHIFNNEKRSYIFLKCSIEKNFSQDKNLIIVTSMRNYS